MDKRITVEEVRAAAGKINRRIGAGEWGYSPDHWLRPGDPCCPVSCLYAARPYAKETWGPIDVGFWGNSVYGVPYRVGFTEAFDGTREPGKDAYSTSEEMQRYRLGRSAGQACRVLLTEQETA